MKNKQFLIAERAYALWLERGCPQGTAEIDWHEAERQLAATESAPGSAVAKMFPVDGPPLKGSLVRS